MSASPQDISLRLTKLLQVEDKIPYEYCENLCAKCEHTQTALRNDLLLYCGLGLTKTDILCEVFVNESRSVILIIPFYTVENAFKSLGIRRHTEQN